VNPGASRAAVGGDGSAPPALPGAGSRRSKQVLGRIGLLLGAYLCWVALALMLVVVRTGSSSSVHAVDGHVTRVIQSDTTLYQVQPGTVRVLLLVTASALVISTASVVWRILRRSPRLGITAMVVGAIVGVGAVLGLLTIGPFIAPLAACLIVLALPFGPPRSNPAPAGGGSPPGWYGDPGGSASWRYWDGRIWTEHTVPSVPPAGTTTPAPASDPA
jgi:hypothetical protein